MPPNGGFFQLCCIDGQTYVGPALLDAYREYLERMIQQTDNLVSVDMFTIPETVDTEGVITEWADVN